MIRIALTRLPHGQGLPLPGYASPGAAGMDVVAAEDVTRAPGQRHAVATGFAIAIPPGHEVQVRPRSGLAIKHGITCLNTPGTIDEDYRGEVKVILANLGSAPFAVKRGERIAQLVPAVVTRPPERSTLQRRATTKGEQELDEATGAKGPMRKIAVIARREEEHPPRVQHDQHHPIEGARTGEQGTEGEDVDWNRQRCA